MLKHKLNPKYQRENNNILITVKLRSVELVLQDNFANIYQRTKLHFDRNTPVWNISAACYLSSSWSWLALVPSPCPDWLLVIWLASWLISLAWLRRKRLISGGASLRQRTTGWMSGSDLGPGWTLQMYIMPQSVVTTNEDFLFRSMTNQNCLLYFNSLLCKSCKRVFKMAYHMTCYLHSFNQIFTYSECCRLLAASDSRLLWTVQIRLVGVIIPHGGHITLSSRMLGFFGSQLQELKEC